jgi:Ni,Fe-hydrogenase I cytochrome b subunit
MQQPHTLTDNNSPFIQTNSAAIRIWHWLTFLFVIALMITVLLESTVLNQRENIPVVQAELQKKGVTVDNNQALVVSHLYAEKIWDLHKLLGYALTFLVLSRIVIEVTQKKEEGMKFRFENALQGLQQSGDNNKDLLHYLLVRISYSGFYLVLLAMATTGMLIAFGSDLGISGPVRLTIKEVHGIFQ